MKIAVYTICLNEEKHVERFMEHASEADYVIILDTGSKDDSVLRLREAGAVVYEDDITPWRFDVARNKCLDLVPDDVDMCFSIDLDETLKAGWRKRAEDAWCHGITRLYYNYSQEDGLPFIHDKFHARNGYRWRHVVHETIYPTDGENFGWALDILVEHWPDQSKPRNSYMALLEQAIKEDGGSSHHMMWLVDEYMNNEKYSCAISQGSKMIDRFQNMWNIHRSIVLGQIANAHELTSRDELALQLRMQSCIESPRWRDPWFDLAKAYFKISKWQLVISSIDHLLTITLHRDLSIASRQPWGAEPFRLAALSSVYLNRFDDAARYFKRGIRTDPTDESIANDYGEFLSQNNPDR